MHTDEFEISLSRELAVCRHVVKKLERFLAGMKRKYDIDTELFVEKFKNGEMTNSRDFNAWVENNEALKKWKNREKQYEELLQMMKI